MYVYLSFRELKPFLEKNKFECRPDAIDSHFKFLRLMEQFGLSRVENERSLQAQLTSMHWRVKHSGRYHKSRNFIIPK